MKKISLPIIIMLFAWLCISCNGGAKNDHKEDSADTGRDTSKFYAVIDKDDIKFAVKAANSSIAEIKLGKLAKEKGVAKQVKNFGALMVKEHTKINNKLIALAKSKKIALPTDPGADGQKAVTDLAKISGKDFDNAYISTMINNHEKYIRLFETAAKTCNDPELNAFAKKMLPTLKRHLEAINGIRDSRK